MKHMKQVLKEDHTIPELHGTVRYRDREMENGGKKLNNGSSQQFETPTNITIKGILGLLMANIDSNDERRIISLGMGDPSAYSCFHTTVVAEEAVVDSLRSEKFNGYSPTVGLPQTRTAIAEYLSRDLPYKLSPDDAFVTSGCTQAIDVALSMLARPGVNILLPRPGFPIYELCAAFRHLEVRHFDLLSEKGWEVDLDAVEALADHNTAAMVIINPGNPCGNVYTYQHLKKIAETAKRLKIPVIADEVYGHLAFGANPFVPMGVFGSVVPVLTLGSLSKRWIVPGWRLGWFVINDPNDIFRNPKIVERLKKYFDILGGPSTFIQAAVPRILQQTEDVFFTKTINILKQTSDICCERIKEIPCISCPYKPVGSMAVMMKLNVSLLKDISDDIDFCFKLAKEESVIILPGLAVGMKDWIRITFAVEPSSLEEAFGRVKSFYHRHSNQQIEY
ncbi:probable aminotransferase TAT2 isoform X2 [Camellia sinensis]|uniref:probable aminotransferase TAT2 isoform X2 n=1 Tax=Camellia sinensis TaxID=4442 RepID=UPI001035DE45|nr:probable aminotransferase TAT2 isoform X2 [Camellia sinensis]